MRRDHIANTSANEINCQDDNESVSSSQNAIAASGVMKSHTHSNANVWTYFDWIWYRRVMEREIVKARTRLPEPDECRKMRNNKRSQMYVVDEDGYSLNEREKHPRHSLFDE
jgi:hypothetical protein